MKVKATSIFLIVLSYLCVCDAAWAEESLQTLKKVLQQREYYLEKKLSYIDSIRRQLDTTTEAHQRYHIYRKLYHSYSDLNVETSLSYAEQMLNLAQHELVDSPQLEMIARLSIIRAYVAKGLYRESSELLNNDVFFPKAIPDSVKALYFGVKLELLRAQYDHAITNNDRKKIDIDIKSTLDSLIAYHPQNSVWYDIHRANRYRADGELDKALEILWEAYEHCPKESKEVKSLTYFIAFTNRLKKNSTVEKEFMIKTAITDVKYGVKSYTALWQLAMLLYREGDVETAYEFIEISLEDALYSGVYRWTTQIREVLPNIYEAYHYKILKQRNTILFGLVAIGALLLVTIVLSTRMVRQNKKLKKAKSELSEVNGDLTKLNTELDSLSSKLLLSNAEMQVANSQLVFLNNELVSTSLLKETYLSKFIDLCSEYIDKLDEYRSDLNRMLKHNQIEKAKKKVQSKQYVEQEVRRFLSSFDETFLKLYPNFVMEFNNLLRREERQEFKENTPLTTELRIFALIRLGITDSSRIARFLRCSITTVYTYRSKAKNKSLCPEQFEEKIREHNREDALLY